MYDDVVGELIIALAVGVIILGIYTGNERVSGAQDLEPSKAGQNLVKEHQIQGPWMSDTLPGAPTFHTRLWHYPDLKVCVLRGYDGYNSSQGGPWAVVVPCPWAVK